MTAEPLQSLLSRVREATGPSEELDALALCAVACPGGAVAQSPINGAWCIYDGSDNRSRPRLWEKRGWHRVEGWPLTASVDAAIAFAERVLPGWHWGLSRCIGEPDGRDSFSASVYDLSVERTMQPDFEEFAATPALAMVAATIAALIAIAKEQTS